MDIQRLISDEALRQQYFPVTRHCTFLGHAGVTALPQVAVDGLQQFCQWSTELHQNHKEIMDTVADTRALAGQLIGAAPEEIALLGPTSLGLSLVANGLPWGQGDEVVYYADDYPANVYPWLALESRGVKTVHLQPEAPGVITWDVVEKALTAKTRLVALASCHFLSGYRIDIDTIGMYLQERGILFCVDAIQTLGAFPVSVQYVDFLAADAHKWLLGPAGAGIFYVKQSRQDWLKPSLQGALNIQSPDYIAQNKIEFKQDATRYEPGELAFPGICGLAGSLRLLLDLGIDAIAARILALRQFVVAQLQEKGYRLYLEKGDSDTHSGIITFSHPEKDMSAIARGLMEDNIVISLRKNREGHAFIRFSPHFYTTEQELTRALALM